MMLSFRNICCRKCEPPKRHVGCHSTCEKYLTERREFEELKAEIEKVKSVERLYSDYRKEQGDKWERKRLGH